MKSFPIYRGTDNEIEFRGLRGHYFYYAAGGLIGWVFTTLFGYILGAHILLAMLTLLVGGLGTVTWCYTRTNRYGRWGAVKQPIQQAKPAFVYQHQSFNRLIPIRKPLEPKTR